MCQISRISTKNYEKTSRRKIINKKIIITFITRLMQFVVFNEKARLKFILESLHVSKDQNRMLV